MPMCGCLGARSLLPALQEVGHDGLDAFDHVCAVCGGTVSTVGLP
jgi:hypothetical protein